MSTQGNIAELRPATPPTRIKDPTAPIRQRRRRQKQKAPPADTKKVQAASIKPKEIKPNVTETKADVTPPRRAGQAVKAVRRQAGTATGVGIVAAILTTLSLSHLAAGITTLTGASTWEGWALAIGVDLGFVALELAQLATVSEKVRKEVSAFARPAIIGTLFGSAAMNALAFAGRYITIDPIAMTVAAVVLGVAIPTLIYCLTRVGAALATDCHARA
jgi:hypothetical protein